MCRLLFLMPILLCAAVSAHAQSLDAFKQRLAEPTPGATLFNRAQVTVTEHDDAARAVAEAGRTDAISAAVEEFAQRRPGLEAQAMPLTMDENGELGHCLIPRCVRRSGRRYWPVPIRAGFRSRKKG